MSKKRYGIFLLAGWNPGGLYAYTSPSHVVAFSILAVPFRMGCNSFSKKEETWGYSDDDFTRFFFTF